MHVQNVFLDVNALYGCLHVVLLVQALSACYICSLLSPGGRNAGNAGQHETSENSLLSPAKDLSQMPRSALDFTYTYSQYG